MKCVVSTHDAFIVGNHKSHPSMVSAVGSSSPSISIKQQVEEVKRLSSQAREAAQTGNYKEVSSSKKAMWKSREKEKSYFFAVHRISR